ncbi:Kinase, NEK [Giardia lamblia P15]|uniref:non-specific serine/threonine protein kinase n=1 Tax=Giardia intestinalis (strain P15) TaxID=658858 RepID=E1F6E4_GIAIA|nr:Kinase, NEK [Giardia lamblia P15]
MPLHGRTVVRGVQNDYSELKQIGEGVFGRCFSAYRVYDNELVQLKEYNVTSMSIADRRQLIEGIEILQCMYYRHIVQFYASFGDPEADVHYMETELCANGSLRELISCYRSLATSGAVSHQNEPPVIGARRSGRNIYIDEAIVWNIAAQAIAGLAFLHNQMEDGERCAVTHRYISPESFGINGDGVLKLDNFEVAVVAKASNSPFDEINRSVTGVVGVPAYRAPEIKEGEYYGPLSDIWSLGCVLLELCTLKVPPVYVSESSEFEVYMPDHYSSELRSFIRSMLKIDPVQRPTSVLLKANKNLSRYQHAAVPIPVPARALA